MSAAAKVPLINAATALEGIENHIQPPHVTEQALYNTAMQPAITCWPRFHRKVMRASLAAHHPAVILAVEEAPNVEIV
jgi:hypothetical protein